MFINNTETEVSKVYNNKAYTTSVSKYIVKNCYCQIAFLDPTKMKCVIFHS